MKVYEHSFDINEWLVIILLITLLILIFVTPKIFTKLESLAYFLYGIYIGMFFDHTISIEPWNLYNVNDSSAYQVIDFISYVMYGPFSYFFIYIYVKLQIKKFHNITYVIIWTVGSYLMDKIFIVAGVFHYTGFKPYWSLPIYLTVQTLLIMVYHILNKEKAVY